MNKQYSFSNEQMNGIVELTYVNIIKECEKTILKIKNMDRDISNRQLQLIYLYRYINELSF